jgi:MFS family permease
MKSNIWKVGTMQFLSNLILFIPVIILFWQENGLNYTQIMILQAIFGIMWVVLEVPSGYFADIYGRKRSIVFGSAFVLAAIIVYSTGSGFFQFLIAELFWAMGISLISGSDSAIVYDSLVELKRKEDYQRIWGNMMFIQFIAMALGTVAGGLIAYENYRLAFYATIPPFTVMTLLSLTLKEPKRHKLIYKKGHINTILNVFWDVIQSGKLKWMMLYSAVVMGLIHGAFWFYQPYFSLVGIEVIYFGFIFAGINVASAWVSKNASRIDGFLGHRSYFLIPILVTIGLAIMANSLSIISIMMALLLQVVWAFLNILMNDYINKHTTSDRRATVISIGNMLPRLIYSALLPLLGVIADTYNILVALNALALQSLVLGGVLLIVFRMKNVLA